MVSAPLPPDTFAAKADLANFATKNDLLLLEQRMTIKLGFMLAAGLMMLFAALKASAISARSRPRGAPAPAIDIETAAKGHHGSARNCSAASLLTDYRLNRVENEFVGAGFTRGRLGRRTRPATDRLCS
jgi:hypothetical protein